MLTPYDWIYGITLITNVFLSIIAGAIALGLFTKTSQKKILGAWKYLLIALILFAVQGIFGALKVLGIWSTPWLTHVIPSFIIVFLIAALLKQINITKGCD